MKKVLLAVLAVVLTAVSVFVTLLKLRLQGVDVGSPRGLGMLTGSTLAGPLIALAIATIWRANRTPSRLLGAANIGLALSVLGGLGQLGKAAPELSTAAASGLKSAPRTTWLRGCVAGCLGSAHKAQPQLTGELAQQFCEANCGCMIQHVTSPGATSEEVVYPNPKFKALPKAAQIEVVTDCTRGAMLVLKVPPAN